jgi:uncharacterized damage-inducible protein DinB
MVRAEHVLDSWKAVRQDTVRAVEEFPAAELDFRPLPEVMSFREVAAHIAVAGTGLSALLLEGERDFTSPDARQRRAALAPQVGATAGTAELVAALQAGFEERLAALAAQPAGFFAELITRFDGQQVTRLEMLQTIKEHELTHRAHLFLCLRFKNLVPATTRRRAAQQPKK